MNSTTHKRDAGSILPMTLAFLALGSLVVMALLSFASTLFLNRPPLEERSDSLEAVRSGMRMAITMQRSHGPEGCFDHPSGSFRINDRTVAVDCQVVTQQDEIGGRFSLIATTNKGNTARNDAAIAATGAAKDVRNDVYVNGGSLAGSSAIKLGNADLVGSGDATSLSSRYRYGVISPSTAIDVPASSGCVAYFGADVQEATAQRPVLPTETNWLTSTQLTVEGDAEPIATPVVIEPVAASGTDILGVIVVDSSGVRRLNRSGLATNRFTVTPSVVTAAINQVSVCHQIKPATDPTFIPDTLTFCGSPLAREEQFSQKPSRDGIDCNGGTWAKNAGWASTVLSDHVYPMLPRIPTYARSSTPLEVGTNSDCFVFYPGRYSADLTLDGGKDYYFASGIYLFEGKVTVKPGARVVGGQGNWQGCTFDAEASFLPGSPRNHDITGFGVTFLLGGNGSATSPSSGRLDIDNASFRLNQRVATDSTRATAGMSVMSVNLATPTPASGGVVDVEIPFNDKVLLPDCLGSEVATNPDCAEDIATYTSTPVEGAPPLTYKRSLLGHDDMIIDVDLDGTVRDDNRVLFGGAVFTPNAAVSFQRSGGGTAYDLQIAGGITATTMEFDFAAGDSDIFLIGQDAEIVYEFVKLRTTTTFDDKEFEALVDLEIDNAARYAINSWVVGSETTNGGGPPPTTSPTTTSTTVAPTTSTTVAPTTSTTTTVAPTTSTTTTTVPPTTSTTTVPPTTTTTVPPTTTTTTVPPTGYDFCAQPKNKWSTNFGPGTWNAYHWKNRTLNGQNSGFARDSKIDVDFGTGKNPVVDKKDDFSILWLQDIKVAKSCTIELRAGGDDGYAVRVDGRFVINKWQDQAFNQTTATITLSPGEHSFEFYFYENTGEAQALFEWRRP